MDCGKQVTVVEMTEMLAPDATFTHRLPLMERMDEYTTYYLKTRCIAVNDTGITVVGEDGEERFIEADTVLISAGMKSNKEEAESFRESAIDFIMIGDCIKPSNVEDAVRTGYEAALQIGSRIKL